MDVGIFYLQAGIWGNNSVCSPGSSIGNSCQGMKRSGGYESISFACYDEGRTCQFFPVLFFADFQEPVDFRLIFWGAFF